MYFCGCLYVLLTLVKGQFEGDAWFPEIDWSLWQETYGRENEPYEQNRIIIDLVFINVNRVTEVLLSPPTKAVVRE